jgi:uncharacterized protein
MRYDGSELILSPTDLSAFLSCRHRVALDHLAALGERQRPRAFDDPLLEILIARGQEHERRYVDQLATGGRTSINLSDDRDPHIAAAKTLAAMEDGVHVIVQGAVLGDRWYGRPDILERIDRRGTRWAWSYEATDTKLARETRAGTILQLSLYSDLLGVLQGFVPEAFHVVTPDPITPKSSYRFAEFQAYYRLVQRQLLGTAARPAREVFDTYYPEPTDICDICAWSRVCQTKRRADDDLSLVAGLSRLQRRELARHDVTTMTALAGLVVPLPFEPERGSIKSYQRIRQQAELQVRSPKGSVPAVEWLPVEVGFGLCRLPEPSPEDLFLDLEGDLFAREGGREYLFGIADAADPIRYDALWAVDDAAERAAFERVMDRIMAARAHDPGMHVYHYAPYEPSAFKRLMGRYATRSSELDQLLREERFVDLYAVVRQAVRVGVERYSIKELEPLYAFERTVPLEEATRWLRMAEVALESHAAHLLPEEVKARVQGYNEDDCVSTRRLRDWLEVQRREAIARGVEVVRPVLPEEKEREVDERAREVEILRGKLLMDVPEVREERTGEQHARWILAYLLDWHRREEKAVWWEYFRLRDLPDEELFDEPQGIAGLEFVERLGFAAGKGGKPTKSVIDRYRIPPQELEIRRGEDLKLRDGPRWGELVEVDREQGLIDVKKGPKYESLHPTSAFAHTHIDTKVMQDALFGIGMRVLESGSLNTQPGASDRAARDLLLRASPRLTVGRFDGHDASLEAARRLALALDDSTLGIQGPPGAGKTYTAARMICTLVQHGKRVGVTANSHKVIQNLLNAVAAAAREEEVAVALGRKDDVDQGDGPIRIYAGNDEARNALADGEVQVLGGTAWLWARPEFVGAVDVLFIDEAGQLSLANVLAVSPAARSLVLLGDPQQLDQSTKGTHPDGVEASSLEHLLGGHATLPPDRGLFLPVTRRLAPSICGFTSELFYEGKLTSKPELEYQELLGADDLSGAGLSLVEVDHDGNRNASDEEVSVVAELVRRLTMPGVTWRREDQEIEPMTGAKILVVAPYNAQVGRLRAQLEPLGVEVGTVDKFQGREAPVVIYSMATSRPEDAPRGLEFLYSVNRLNVATSRARCRAILVANPRLFEPECRSPRQMRLANALCRFRELARVVVL